MENEVKEPAPKYNFVEQEDYLTLERTSDVKHEYYRGEVFAMSGASWEHNVIVKNVNTIVLPFLKGKTCNMFGSDLRIHIPENSLYTYPDLSIVCGEKQVTDVQKDTVTNPTVIIEILSSSTKDYDRGSKFMLYRSIKTLNEYITIDSTSISVEIYTRQDSNHWLLSEYKQLTDTFVISAVGLTLSLNDVYEDVKIEP